MPNTKIMRWLMIVALMAMLWCALGCGENVTEADHLGELPDQPAENEPDQGDGTDDPWNLTDAVPVVRIQSPSPGEFDTDKQVQVSGFVNGNRPESILLNGKT